MENDPVMRGYDNGEGDFRDLEPLPPEQQSAEVVVGRSSLPEGIEEYAGKWVTIRNGEVVIAVDSSDDLFNSQNYQSTDLVYLVPEPGPKFYET